MTTDKNGDPTGIELGVEFSQATYLDVSQRTDVHHLRGKSVGLSGVLFLTVTGAAPISAMLFNTPIVVGYGNGRGAPAAFIVATTVLLVFSVGYVAMARRKTAAGGFYSFISHGLGRPLGLATGFAAVLAYSVFEASLAGGFAYFSHVKLASFGVNVAWPWLALGMVLIIAVLSYLDVRISSAVLGTALVLEILALIIYDIGTLTQVPLRPGELNPVYAFQGFAATGKLSAGAAGIGLFFAFWSWVGFEMACNYGEESRNPKRIVPRALYISVIGLGILYALTAWAGLDGYPTVAAAKTQAQTNAASFYFAPATQYVGGWLKQMMSYLIITGSFACGMAFHNTASRYMYSLGRERILPPLLGRTHHRWKSPHLASITQTVLALVAVGAFAGLIGTSNAQDQAYGQLYALMAMMGVIIILSVQALTSLAILVHFEVHDPAYRHWWRTRLAPAIAFITQGYVVYLLFKNISFIGGGIEYAIWLAVVDLIVFLVGLLGAFVLKRRAPQKYSAVGRLVNEGG